MSARPSDPTWPNALAAAKADLAQGRPDLALRRLEVVVAHPDAPSEAFRLCALALQALGRPAAAVPFLEQVVRAHPASVAAEHNLAAALGDLGDARRAAEAAQRALDKGGTAPETWLVLGRALQGLGRLPEAQAALERSLALRPAQTEARRDLAQLIWMRTGDADAAMTPFSLTDVPAPLHAPLTALGAAALLDMVGERAAYDWLNPRLRSDSPPALHLAAAKAAGAFDPDRALRHAEIALQAAPDAPQAHLAYATALMNASRPADALPLLDRHLDGQPDDQYAIGLRHAAWRVLSDPRALGPSDYATLVQATPLDPPERCPAVPAWMAQAGLALGRLHAFQAHPFDQSIRSGVQAPIDPRWAGEPVLDEVFQALRAPIDTYVARMAGRSDPMSRRAAAGWEMTGAWSVRLRAGGRHTDHVHPRGWISSALHLVVPAADPAAPRAGWLRFGAVRLGAGLSLDAEHWVEPRPGQVVLFPAWMWHGTEPVFGDGERLTIAFDVQPR